MTTNKFQHFTPDTLARLAAELIANHTTPGTNGRGLTFATEHAHRTFVQVVAAGGDQIGVEAFYPMIDEARQAAPTA